MLEQFCHINQKPSNQLVSTPHLEPIKLKTTPTIVRQGVISPQGTWPTRSILGQGER
jgi:hypothetical protein